MPGSLDRCTRELPASTNIAAGAYFRIAPVSRPERAADILVLGQQGLVGPASRSLANANHFEAENVLVDCTGADQAFFTAEDNDLALRLRRQLGAAARSLRPGRSIPSVVGSRIHLQRDYRVAIALVRTAWDVTLLETVADLRQRADVVVLWVFEMWPWNVTHKLSLAPFHLADLVVVGPSAEAATSLDALIAPPVRFMPAGIDVDTFGVATFDTERPFDLMNIGRREAGFHDLFLARARSNRRRYLFDTTTPGLLRNSREHRWLLAQNYQASKVAMTSAAKFDVFGSGDGSIRAVPNRLFEALAAGTIMVGAPPPSELNQTNQVGAIVVRELPSDVTAAVEIVEQLADTDLTEERRHNAELARRHHDWSERWLRVFDLAGQTAPESLQLRLDRLT